jgi:hypothetical protein
VLAQQLLPVALVCLSLPAGRRPTHIILLRCSVQEVRTLRNATPNPLIGGPSPAKHT